MTQLGGLVNFSNVRCFIVATSFFITVNTSIVWLIKQIQIQIRDKQKFEVWRFLSFGVFLFVKLIKYLVSLEDVLRFVFQLFSLPVSQFHLLVPNFTFGLTAQVNDIATHKIFGKYQFEGVINSIKKKCTNGVFTESLRVGCNAHGPCKPLQCFSINILRHNFFCFFREHMRFA